MLLRGVPLPFTPFVVDPDDDPFVALLRGMQLMDEIDEFLLPLGLSVSVVLDGIREVDAERAMAEPTVGEWAATGPTTGLLEGPRARFHATSWWAHGLSVTQVATLLGRLGSMHDQLVAEVDRYITSRPTVQSERAVLELHRLGMSPGDIALRLGMRRNTVDNYLHRLAVHPNLKQPRIVETIRNGVIADRNRGRSYPDLRKKYNLTTNQVRSILRHAARAGLINNYGQPGEDEADAS